jgi:hypothetical protein
MGDRIRLALSAAFYLLALAATMSGIVNQLIAILLGMIATALLIWASYHRALEWHQAKKNDRKRGLDSWYFIAPCLALAVLAAAVAAYGFGLRSASAHAEPQAKIDTTPPPTQMALRRQYIGESKQLFDANLTKLTRLLNGKGFEAVKIADRFLPAFADASYVVGFQSRRYEQFKTAPQEAKAILDEINEAIWGKILRENRDQLADLNDVLQNGDSLTKFKKRMEQTVRYFDSFRIIYEKGDEQTSSNAAVLFATLQEPTQKDVAAFNEWIEDCNRRIEAKRKALEKEK